MGDIETERDRRGWSGRGTRCKMQEGSSRQSLCQAQSQSITIRLRLRARMHLPTVPLSHRPTVPPPLFPFSCACLFPAFALYVCARWAMRHGTATDHTSPIWILSESLIPPPDSLRRVSVLPSPFHPAAFDPSCPPVPPSPPLPNRPLAARKKNDQMRARPCITRLCPLSSIRRPYSPFRWGSSWRTCSSGGDS